MWLTFLQLVVDDVKASKSEGWREDALVFETGVTNLWRSPKVADDSKVYHLTFNVIKSFGNRLKAMDRVRDEASSP